MFNKRVYYISGFDPRGARFYHRLFREESQKSTVLSGAKIDISKRKVIDSHVTKCDVKARWNNQDCLTDYQFLTWDDVMKDYWVSSLWLLILKSIPMYLNHIKTRLFPKFKKAGNGPYICSILPLAFCLTTIILSVLIGLCVYVIALSISSSVLFSVIATLAITYYLVKFALGLGERIGAWWILQTYFFISRWIKSPLDKLELKMQIFADKIIEDQNSSPVEEIIIVGHCVGSMIVTKVIANILDTNHHHLKNKLSIVTLGQCIPYLSYAKEAVHFRKDLEKFSNNESFAWIDMGAKSDPLCFHDVNPAEAEGINLKDNNVPYRFTVRPYKMFSPEKYKSLKKNKLRLHFQYLMAADIKTDFDYFEIVTGPNGIINNYK